MYIYMYIYTSVDPHIKCAEICVCDRSGSWSLVSHVMWPGQKDISTSIMKSNSQQSCDPATALTFKMFVF